MIIITIIAFIVSALFCSSLAAEKGYSAGLYFFLGLLFGPFVLLYLIGIPESDDRVRANREALAEETAKRMVTAYFDELDRREGTRRPETVTVDKPRGTEVESAEVPEESYADEDKMHYVRPMSYYNNKCPNCGTEYNTSRDYCRCGAQFGAVWREKSSKQYDHPISYYDGVCPNCGAKHYNNRSICAKCGAKFADK